MILDGCWMATLHWRNLMKLIEAAIWLIFIWQLSAFVWLKEIIFRQKFLLTVWFWHFEDVSSSPALFVRTISRRLFEMEPFKQETVFFFSLFALVDVPSLVNARQAEQVTSRITRHFRSGTNCSALIFCFNRWPLLFKLIGELKCQRNKLISNGSACGWFMCICRARRQNQ